MRISSVLSLTLACSALTATAQNSAATKRPISLQECIQLALEHNLSIQIQRFNPAIAELNLYAAYSPYDPVFRTSFTESFSSQPGRIDPVTSLPSPPSENNTEVLQPGLTGELPIGLGTSYNLSARMQRSSGTSFPTGFQYQDNASLSITQPLLRNLWIDDTRLSIKLNKLDLSTTELGVQVEIMRVVTLVENAYYDLIFSRENVKVQEKALELADQLLAENKKRVEVGALAPLDEKQAESQVAQRRADLINAYATLNTQQNTIKSLVSDDFASFANVQFEPTDSLLAIPTEVSEQESWTKGMNKRPEITQARNNLEKRNITLKYDFNQLFPQLDLTASYGHNGLGTTVGDALNNIQQGNNPFYSAGVVLSIPLSNRAARSRYKQSKELLGQQLLNLKKQEQDILLSIDNAVKNTRTFYQRIDATRQARLYAEAALEAEQKKLESGKSTSFVVLQLQRDLTSARSDEIRALADYNKSLATLAREEGVTLERAKIDVQVR